MDGIIVINKEKGFTSFDVVAKLRGILGIRKIGHTGTLDPDATGVLPVCIGKATGLCDMLTDSGKEYEAVMLLGVTTDTQDISGTILHQAKVTCSVQEITDTISQFVGDIMQVPPMYSALKVNGKKLCDLARAGIEIERQPRPITIQSIDIMEIMFPMVKMRVKCSKGTYIRSLCHDIGQKLGCGACMKELIRTSSAGFDINEAVTLSDVEEYKLKGELTKLIRPIDSVFQNYRKLIVYSKYQKTADNGNFIKAEMIHENIEDIAEQERVRIYSEEGIFYGIYRWEPGYFKPVKLFFSYPATKYNDGRKEDLMI